MRYDLASIVTSLINNIGSAQVTAIGDFNNKELMTENARLTCEGLDVLKDNWPNLSQTEKEEIAAIILTLKTTYPQETQKKK